MHLGPMVLAHRAGWRVATLLALVVGMVAVPLQRAEAVQRPETLYHERAVGTGPVEPGFPIDNVGIVFDLPADADHDHDHQGDAHAGAEHLQVRFRVDGVWGPWQGMTEDGAQAVGTWTGALVSGGDAEAYQVRGLPSFARNARAAAINTTDGEPETVGYRPAGSAAAVTTCKSRADWLADESLRTSNRSYAPVQILTVHHTATTNDDPDPDARVRAIYKYHTQTNNWDDIGYQALISEAGTVYEGRWSGSDSASCATGGGTGADFGHETTAADASMVTGAHTGGYNTGNFGVALLGTLTDVGPKAAARTALVEYLAELSVRHGLDPEGEVAYDNGTNAKLVPTISGHRDFNSTECPGGTMYADLPQLRTDTAAAVTSGPAVTISLPADADAYAVQAGADGTAAVSFAASGTDDRTAATDLTWRWTRDTSQVSTASSFDETLAPGTYVYTATATDLDGETGSDEVTVTVTSADAGGTTTVDDVASGEQFVAGTVSGTYVDTRTDGGGAESITEIESGGKPASRHSFLEHVWTVPVTGGDAVTLFVDAATTGSGDGDGFAFAYSTDGGTSYSAPVVTVPAGADGTWSATLPAGLSGTVRVRVTDTDRTAGANRLDTITVDHLFVRSGAGTAVTPATPAGLNASGPTATTVDLAWSDVDGEHGYELERSTDGGATWTAAAMLGADTVAHRDTGLTSATTYHYRLRAYNSAGPSAWSEPATATTTAVTGIVLTTSGRKARGGAHVVDLSWTGATEVLVYRNGTHVATVTGSSYIDEIGGKGRASYTHQVCATSGGCSEVVTTTFS